MADFSAPREGIVIDQGDDETVTITRQHEDGSPIDITGYTVWLTVKESRSDADADAVVQKQETTHTDPTNGITELTLTAADTEPLAGSYYYDVQEKTAGGTVNTLLAGVFHVQPDVTNTT